MESGKIWIQNLPGYLFYKVSQRFGEKKRWRMGSLGLDFCSVREDEQSERVYVCCFKDLYQKFWLQWQHSAAQRGLCKCRSAFQEAVWKSQANGERTPANQWRQETFYRAKSDVEQSSPKDKKTSIPTRTGCRRNAEGAAKTSPAVEAGRTDLERLWDSTGRLTAAEVFAGWKSGQCWKPDSKTPSANYRAGKQPPVPRRYSWNFSPSYHAGSYHPGTVSGLSQGRTEPSGWGGENGTAATGIGTAKPEMWCTRRGNKRSWKRTKPAFEKTTNLSWTGKPVAAANEEMYKENCSGSQILFIAFEGSFRATGRSGDDGVERWVFPPVWQWRGQRIDRGAGG